MSNSVVASPISLRPYQIEAVNALWKAIAEGHTALCALPCGAGKTEITIEFISRLIEKYPDLRIVVLLNNVDLLSQTVRRYSARFDVGVYCGSLLKYDASKPITVASIQSIYDVPLDKVNMIIVDECHELDHTDGRYFNFIKRLRESNERLKLVGFSATPYRADGLIYGKDKLFDSISYKKTISWMIENGYLCKPVMKRPDHQFSLDGLKVVAGEYSAGDVDTLVKDRNKCESQITDALSRMGGCKKVVWACANIDHAEMVRASLVLRGELATVLHSKQSAEVRAESKDYFEKGNGRHLAFVSILRQGYDYPPIDCIVLLRPIRSPNLYIQISGRGLRLSPNKESLLLLDYGRCVETLGTLDDPVIPALNKKPGKKLEAAMKFCKNCLSYIAMSCVECPDCHTPCAVERDPTKNLVRKASESGDLLGLRKIPEVTAQVYGVKTYKHASKSGNTCLRITYSTSLITYSHISKYYVWNSTRARLEAQRMCINLGIDAPMMGEDIMSWTGTATKLPVSLRIKLDKWPEIVSVSWNGETGRNGDTNLA